MSGVVGLTASSVSRVDVRSPPSLPARLWQAQGKANEARDLLTPIYGWFTEGVDTPDLIDAKVLLDELK